MVFSWHNKTKMDSLTVRPIQSSPTARDDGVAINLLAPALQVHTVKSLKAQLRINRITQTVKIIPAGDNYGLLIHFESWKILAQYHEWISRNGLTQQLLFTIRVECGPIHKGSSAHEMAKRIMQKYTEDQEITHEECENDSDPEHELQVDFPNFQNYLMKGIFCTLCKVHHPLDKF